MTNFFTLLAASQEERDAAPCVAPTAGHIGLMRNGIHVYLMSMSSREGLIYQPHGECGWDDKGRPLFRPWHFDKIQHDIIATLNLTAVGAELATLQTRRTVLEANRLHDQAEIARLRSALEAYERAKWQPVETAPRGKWLLTYRTGDTRATMAQLGFGDEWISPRGHTTVTLAAYLPPTHWQPLPEPPVLEGE